MNGIEVKIKSILSDRLQVDPRALEGCSCETPLLGIGLGLDSIEAMSLAAGIEGAFDIQIDDDDLTEQLFENLSSLANYVQLKMAEGGRAS